MLPSSTLVTPSVLAMVPTSTALPLNEKADVRAATFSASIFDSAFSSSSARPSQKCSLSTSALMLANGSTASDVMARGVAAGLGVAQLRGVGGRRAAGAARPVAAERLFRVGEVEQQLRRRRISLRAVLLQRPADDSGHGRRHPRQRRRFARQHRDDDVGGGAGSKRRRPRQQLVEERAKAEEVRLLIDVQAARLLG